MSDVGWQIAEPLLLFQLKHARTKEGLAVHREPGLADQIAVVVAAHFAFGDVAGAAEAVFEEERTIGFDLTGDRHGGINGGVIQLARKRAVAADVEA